MVMFTKMEVCYLRQHMSLQSWMVVRFVLEGCHHKHVPPQSFHHTLLVFCTWLTLLFQLPKSCLSIVLLSITFLFLHKSGSIPWFLIVRHHLFLQLKDAAEPVVRVSTTPNIRQKQREMTTNLAELGNAATAFKRAVQRRHACPLAAFSMLASLVASEGPVLRGDFMAVINPLYESSPMLRLQMPESRIFLSTQDKLFLSLHRFWKKN